MSTKTTKTSRARKAFTRTELMVVLVMMSFFAALFVRAQSNPAEQTVPRVACLNNLRQLGLAFRLWSIDHKDKYPMRVAIAEAGSREAVEREEPWLHFAVLSNELANPRVLVCPADNRPAATNFNLTITNLSYFAGLDADGTFPQMLLTGDRNITNGFTHGNVIELVDAPPAGWDEMIHNVSGNIGLADGSARYMTNLGLQRQVTAANDSTRKGVTRLHLPIPPTVPTKR